MNRNSSGEAVRATVHLLSTASVSTGTGGSATPINGIVSGSAEPAIIGPAATTPASAASYPADAVSVRLLREVEDLVIGFGEVVRKFRLTPTSATDLEQVRRYGEVLSRYVEMVTRLATPASTVPVGGMGTVAPLSTLATTASTVTPSEAELAKVKSAVSATAGSPTAASAIPVGLAVPGSPSGVTNPATVNPGLTNSAVTAATAPLGNPVPPLSHPAAPITALGRAIADLREAERNERFGRDRDGHYRDNPRIRSATSTVPEAERRLRDPQEVFADLRAVERELEEVNAKADAELPVESRLLILKSLACRQRGLFDELQMQRCEDTRAREMYAQLKDTIEKLVARTSDPNQYQYVIPLDTRATPRHPSDWYEAARRYAALPECLAALEWLTSVLPQLSDTDKKEILEPVAARQQRLYRVLQQRFHSTGQEALSDPQQGMLFGRLREYARTHSIFLIGLNGHTEEAELERLANQLPAALERQKTRLRRKQEQEDAVAKVVSTVTGARFGSREQHADLLQVLVRRVLELGVPPQHPPLRDALLDWGHLLGSEDKFVPLLKAIEAEKRRRDAQKALLEEESRETELDPVHAGELARVLPCVAGGRGVLIGGPCRDENRAVIANTLKLTELVWEDTTGRDQVHDFEPLISAGGVRVVFLMVRMMKPGFGRIADLCRKHGRWLVRLPGGFGINSVVQQMSEQLVNLEPPAPAAVAGTVSRDGSPESGTANLGSSMAGDSASSAGPSLSAGNDRSSSDSDAMSPNTPLLT